LAIAWIAGCGSVRAPAAVSPPTAPLLGPASPVTLGRDQVTLLRSGLATFARLRSLIDGARLSIHVEIYEFGQPPLAVALVSARRRGVAVTVIDDPSELTSVATAAMLRARGVDVVDYPIRSQMIDHVKLLVVDARVAVVGGINWGVNSPANHDYDAEVRGPAVGNLDLELFVLTDTGVVHALESAALRGVNVRILLDPSQPSSDPSYAALLADGIEVRWYRSHGELLHAKAIVVDATSLLFGSANWSGGGFARNHELDIELPAAATVAEEMLAQMNLDWAASG